MEEDKSSVTPPVLYDVVILGASGFTGKYVIRECLKFLNTTPSFKSMAIAGRSSSKLTTALEWAARPGTPPASISIITADVHDSASLVSLCAKTRLLLNCVGPFRLYGAPVVAACVQTGTDYLDISGEPEFMERMELEYHGKAVDSGSLVVSACGFDSVPAELGLMFNARQWIGPSSPSLMEAYLSLESEKRIVGNFATYESAVLGVASVDNLRELRRRRPKRAMPKIPGPYPGKGSLIDYHKDINVWGIKLPSADTAVVRRTLSILAENPSGLCGLDETTEEATNRSAFWSTIKPAHFGVKTASKSLMCIIRFITIGMFIGSLGKFSVGRWLLLNFPSFFSLGMFRKTGPSEDEVESASFKMWFVSEGFSNVNQISESSSPKLNAKVITRVTGPEIGYITTPITLIQCALIVLNERNRLPRGGVFPPGIVFGSTDLQERLQQNGLTFDVISKVNISR